MILHGRRQNGFEAGLTWIIEHIGSQNYIRLEVMWPLPLHLGNLHCLQKERRHWPWWLIHLCEIRHAVTWSMPTLQSSVCDLSHLAQWHISSAQAVPLDAVWVSGKAIKGWFADLNLCLNAVRHQNWWARNGLDCLHKSALNMLSLSCVMCTHVRWCNVFASASALLRCTMSWSTAFHKLALLHSYKAHVGELTASTCFWHLTSWLSVSACDWNRQLLICRLCLQFCTASSLPSVSWTSAALTWHSTMPTTPAPHPSSKHFWPVMH